MNQPLIEFYKGRRENEVHGYSDRLEASMPEMPALDELQRRIDEADKKQDDISARIGDLQSEIKAHEAALDRATASGDVDAIMKLQASKPDHADTIARLQRIKDGLAKPFGHDVVSDAWEATEGLFDKDIAAREKALAKAYQDYLKALDEMAFEEHRKQHALERFKDFARKHASGTGRIGSYEDDNLDRIGKYLYESGAVRRMVNTQ